MPTQLGEQETDEQVIERVVRGDSELYRVIVERYQDRLLRYAAYFMKDYDEAADVVQEVFIKAYINLRGFNTKKKFSSWIYRIVHNEALNMIKKRHQAISLDENAWVENISDKERNLHKELEEKEISIALRTCLDELPFLYREPLVLYYFENRPYTEIAEILRLPIGTVGTRVTRGRALLKNLWIKHEAKHDG